jgi:hypothetical protein
VSGPLAIAGVSAVLRDLLQTGMTAMQLADSLGGALSGDVEVGVGAPDRVVTSGTGAGSKLNLFLYNVARNVGWANLGLPSRDARGNRVDNPVLGVDLYYLLTAYGAQDFDAEVLLGGAMQVLHDTPGLDRDEIRTVLGTGVNLPKNIQFCGLADQAESIRISPLPMSTEEIVRLWSAFQSNYRPSVAYLVTVVLLQSAKTARKALPVRGRNLYARTFRQPRIDRVERADDPLGAITADATVRIYGANLETPTARLLVNGIDLSAGITLRGPNRLDFTLQQPPGSQWPAGLCPGIAGLQLLAPELMGTPPVAHGAVESNLLAFLLAPTITATKISGGVRVKSDIAIGKDQRVNLLLNELGAPPDRPARGYTFGAPAGNGVTGNAVATNTIDIPVAGVSAGSYLVRVQVDGVESPLTVDNNGVYAKPNVTL